jgi:excisionase family DNA binding protein
MEAATVERRTYSVEEAGAILGVSRALAYQLAREGRIPAIRLGRRLVVPRARLEEMLAERTVGDAAA